MRLRRVTVTSPGYTRRPKGDAWVFLDVEGLPLADEEEVARCERLAVPPAWSDVWICRYPNGHIQAFGRDLAGRGQYLYHEQWQVRRARRKHDHVLDVGRRLPAARRRVARELELPGMPRDKVLALAFRLLDLAYFRAGGEIYAKQNNSYGLATIRKEHARVRRDGSVHFHYPAKSGQV
ncbi:MAG: DNA topoisomerase IB, partial [Cellulosimicrobium funkei]